MKTLLRKLVAGFGYEVTRRSATSFPSLRRCECDGRSFPFWIANAHTAEWWGSGRVRMDAEMRFLKDACRPGSVVLEAGSHHGMHTLQMSRWVGAAGAVHALELNATNALVLSANVGVNSAGNVVVRHTAVGDRTDTVKVAGERVDGSGVAVPSTTLDDYCAGASLSRVDVVKIDVEGFEGRVLAGAAAVLAQRPAIDLELHLDDLERYGDEVETVLELLGPALDRARMMIRPDWEREVGYSLAALPRRQAPAADG
jgi:FkbM family methyltransferase